MTYEMRRLRKEDISLYYYLKHIALFDFVEKEEMAYLQELETHDACEEGVRIYEALTEWCEGPDPIAPDPTERGRGWVYLERNTISGTNTLDLCNPYTLASGTDVEGNYIWGIKEQDTMIEVIDEDLTTVSAASYVIDYLDGRIITDDTTVNPKYVTYHWHYISLVDEWAAVQASNPPVIVIDMHGTDKAGYQLGPGRKTTRKVDLHIFATDPAERNDIVEALVDALHNKTAPLYAFPSGTILEYDGTWRGRKDNRNKLTSLFNRTTLSNYAEYPTEGVIGNMIFENVTSRHVSLPLLMTRDRNEVMLSDLNAYRSKVSFDLVTYTRS